MTPRSLEVEQALGDDRWIRRLASSLVLDQAEADDALQEARLALMRSPPLRLADPRPWLVRVALNFVRKRRREEARRQQRERRAARAECLAASPAEAMERVELRRQVLDAVLDLAEPYRSTLVQRYFEEMSLEAIARSRGLPLNTVKTHASRALGILRRRLEALHGGRGAWAVLLIPFLAPRLPGASVLTRRLAGNCAGGTKLIHLGVTTMSIKAIAAAVGVSGVITPRRTRSRVSVHRQPRRRRRSCASRTIARHRGARGSSDGQP